jgi:hypothetical protein
MSTDPLGNLFSRIRDAVDDQGNGDADELAATPASTPETTSVPADSSEREGAPEPIAEIPEYESPVVGVDLLELGAVEAEPNWPVFGVAESVRLDDVGLRRRRDATVGAAVATLTPRVKRQLQDEQNDLLDALRRQKTKIDASTAFPSAQDQLAAWTGVLGPAVDDVYAAGRTLGGGRTRPAPEMLVQRLAEALVGPLRERAISSLQVVVQEGPYDGAAEWQRAISSAIGARYREFRAQNLELALGDMLVWAFARGIYDATPDGTRIRWIPAEIEQCPDADDNALEPTEKGRPFPTGQACVPAHLGCRCLVVPTDG